jgi:hypothetical protein
MLICRWSGARSFRSASRAWTPNAEVCSACELGKRTPHAAVVLKVTRARRAVNTNLSALERRNAVSRAAASPTYLTESSGPWNAVACRMDVSNAINISDDVHFPFRSPHAPSSSEEARRSAFSAD